jgi:hypothetical protein
VIAQLISCPAPRVSVMKPADFGGGEILTDGKQTGLPSGASLYDRRWVRRRW